MQSPETSPQRQNDSSSYLHIRLKQLPRVAAIKTVWGGGYLKENWKKRWEQSLGLKDLKALIIHRQGSERYTYIYIY